MAPPVGQHYELVVPPQIEFLAVDRNTVKASIDAIRFGTDAMDKLMLVLTEVVANAVEATNNFAEAASAVQIDWTVLEDGVAVTVSDQAGGFDPSTIRPRPQLEDADGLIPEGGFGLGLIRTFADVSEFTARQSGTAVEFMIYNSSTE